MFERFRVQVYRLKARLIYRGRQTCKCCGKVDGFNFHVPDDLWARVVPTIYRNHVLCLLCFDKFAHRRCIPYAGLIEDIVFVGDEEVIGFEIRESWPCPRVEETAFIRKGIQM